MRGYSDKIELEMNMAQQKEKQTKNQNNDDETRLSPDQSTHPSVHNHLTMIWNAPQS